MILIHHRWNGVIPGMPIAHLGIVGGDKMHGILMTVSARHSGVRYQMI